jgi:hypothetical protein
MGDLGLVGFAEQAFKSFLRLDALSQIVTFFALYGPVVGGTTLVVRRRMRRTEDELRIENKALSDLRDKINRHIEALEREVTALKKAAPASIFEEMQRERGDGNEFAAVRALIRGFETITAHTGHNSSAPGTQG